jgi:hypothetical protein
MRVFRVKEDLNNMQMLQPTDYSKINLERFTFDCEPMRESWEEDDLTFYISNPKIKPKNFYGLASGCLVFDEKVLSLCEMIFEMCGEVLPLKVERGPQLYCLNILQCMNALNYDKTVWRYYDSGAKGNILKHSMHKDRVINGTSLFKIPENSKSFIFCYADFQDREGDFYHIYHDNNLTGLFFEEIEIS